MKKKTISVLVTLSLLTGMSQVAFAAPNTDTSTQKQQIEQDKKKLDDVNSKINDITAKIDALTDKIQPLMAEIDKNDKKIEDIKVQIVSTQEEIKKIKEDLDKKEDAFGSRMRKIYKSGGETDYLSLIFSASSLSDLIDKIQAVGNVMSLDKQVINDIKSQKELLDSKVNSLQAKQDEIVKINDDNKSKAAQLQTMKDEQQKDVDQLQEEKKKVVGDLASSEKALLDYPISIINNSSSSTSDLRSAIEMIHSARGNISLKEVDDQAKQYIDKAQDIIKQRDAAQSQSQSQSNADSSNVNRGNSVASGDASTLLNYAYKFIGKPYVWAAKGPDSFDCSGFTSYVYRHLGIDIGGDTYTQIEHGTPVSYSDLKPGDLIFTRGVQHVGIYVGNGQMIHAPRPGETVTVGPIYEYSSARRILH
ncbi:NlpC/P60 family protein [Inconstantimicrobium mannanitabidum]|uniref:Uncharacterized protein n=1 Tax=Inconstantimicrobium mannanitabidum TaxID=1604901 RepID=A0ACB5RG87_9CLOT|nr:C40 family peptidase [Clostridium sp. TW13]GKX68064.1 hypothetical protein rsdtw13_33220 [Clostridium sp. TW13]